LNISIKSTNISIHKSDRKLLVDNVYLPPQIVNGRIVNPYNIGGSKFNYLKNIYFYDFMILGGGDHFLLWG
jgi:hypothetical protein